VTLGSENVPKAGEHPDPGLIAAHAEQRLSGAEAARMDEHLAGCPTCHEVFAETLRFALDEDAEEALPRMSATVIPFVRRPAFRWAAVLAAAAGVFLVFQPLWRARSERPGAPLVAELAHAMGTKRFVEPRLTGGFQHGRLVILRSGDRPQGLDAHSPAVLGAVARIRERAEGDTSPGALGALAVTYLVSGDIGKAVKALESATAQDPKNPRLQNDLAAAYLVRANRLDEPADIPKALEAAEKAIELDDAPDEAWFNRALALESLHLVDSAKKAWGDFLKRDSTSGWADEARKHLEELPPAQQSTIEEDRARARAALAEGSAAIDRLADESPSILADYFLSELLPAWADAQLTGHPNALVLRTQAQQVGEALFRTTGDALPRDAALVLALPLSGASRDPPRTQALGYKALHEAQRLYDLQQPSCDTFREARSLLDEGGSNYAAWASERIVSSCRELRGSEGLAELNRLEGVVTELPYLRLLARVHWGQGLLDADRGAFETSLSRYRLACDGFRSLRDPGNEARCLSGLSQALHLAGDDRSAWRDRLRGLALFGTVREPSRRHAMLRELATACLDERLARSALHAQTAVVEAARRWERPTAISDALIWRANVLSALRLHDGALTDLVEARQWLPRIADRNTAEILGAELDAAEGRMFVMKDPERAVVVLARAAERFERREPSHEPGIRALLALAEAARGRDDAAEMQLEAGIRRMELQRESLFTPSRQTIFFDQAGSLFDQMIDLQVDTRHDPRRALSFLERGRARQLLDSLAPHAPGRAPAYPLEPEALQRALPTGVALVYYACEPDRVLSWVVARDSLRLVEHPLEGDDLPRRVAAHEAAVEGRANVSLLRQEAASLFDHLIRPLEPVLGNPRVLMLIPDRVLQPVAFASLWDRRTGRFLVEDYVVGMAPSGSVFVRASAAGVAARRRNTTLSLLAVANPKFNRSRWPGLPDLPGAAIEAGEIAGLYENATLLTGAKATRSGFLLGARHKGVVHFAGHAVQGDASSPGRLVLAPERDGPESDALDLYDLRSGSFPATRAVVLAGCRTGAGSVSRIEGTLSMARPFLAAGVPSVVAALWDVDDATSREFFVAFHRSLIAVGDPLKALQLTQRAFLKDKDPWLAHPATWAGYVAIGGIAERSLSTAGQTDSL